MIFEFVVFFFVFGAMALLLAIPVLVVAWRRHRPDISRKFGVAAVAIGLACAAVSINSNVLVSQCSSAGNTACIDYGATGFQVLLLSSHALASWIGAFLLARN